MTLFLPLWPRLADKDIVTASDILGSQKPFFLFIGGHFHVNNQDNGPGLSQTLAAITRQTQKIDTPIYGVVVNEKPDFGKTVSQVGDYLKLGKISNSAMELVDTLFLPGTFLQTVRELPPPSQMAALSAHFRRFNLIGYSYGTSLIQQIEEGLEDRLKHHGLPLNAMNHIAALSIGAVAPPRIFHRNSSIRRLNAHQSAAATTSLFRQLLVLEQTDKVAEARVGDTLFTPPNDGFASFGNRDVTVLVDSLGDAMQRRAGISFFASGDRTPKIEYSLDHEGHKLRVYANRFGYQSDDEKGRQMILFPSGGLGPAIENALSAMARESHAGEDMPRHFHTQKVIFPGQSRDHLPDEVRSLKQIFAQTVHDYQKTGFKGSLDLMEKLVQRAPELAARHPHIAAMPG